MHGELIHGEITEKVLAAAIEAHKHPGPGLLESAHEACLCRELAIRGLAFRRQRLDLVAEDKTLVGLKRHEGVLPIHEAQLMTYLKLTGMRVSPLLNFNVPIMKDGIVRRVL